MTFTDIEILLHKRFWRRPGGPVAVLVTPTQMTELLNQGGASRVVTNGDEQVFMRNFFTYHSSRGIVHVIESQYVSQATLLA